MSSAPETTPATTRTTRAVVVVALTVTALSGCGFRGASSLPLPGGQGNGEDAYELTVEFTDVLDLVVQSAVKVDDVTVGSVTSVEATGYTARVLVNVNGDITLPANSRASVRQTSLLGEKFVSLDAPPPSESSGQLRGGETIGLDRTSRSAEIEEVLSALSLVLNGGSLEQLQVINKEVTLALDGREARVKDLLGQLDTFVGGLDAQKGQIVRALDSLDRLSTRLVGERETIATALEDIPSGVKVLTDQRKDLTALLTSLDKLSDVAVRVIDASQANTVADLNALVPILSQLNAAGQALPESLELLTTYPFPRSVTDGIKGDYANLFATADVDLRGATLPLPKLPKLPAVPKLPGVPKLPVPLPKVPKLPVPVPKVPPLPVPLPKPPAVPRVPGSVPVPSPTPGGVLPIPGLGLNTQLPQILGVEPLGLLQLLLGGML